MTYPPDHIVVLAPGPPLFVPGLGLLPGPPTVLKPLDPTKPTLYVDDRNAGQDTSCGTHSSYTITTQRALTLLGRQVQTPAQVQVDPPSPAVPPTAQAPAAPVTSLRRAAKLLRVGRTTLSKRIDALPPEQRPSRSNTHHRPRWWWPSPDACLAWWQEVNAVAGPTSVAVAPPPTPAPPPRPRSGGPSLVERLAALQRPDAD